MMMVMMISCHCAGPLLSTSPIHGRRGWSCNIHSMVLHGAFNQDKLSLCRPSFKYLSHPWGEGVEL